MGRKSTHRQGAIWYMLSISVITLILILDSRLAAQAMAQGLTRCINTLIPSLFPLMVMARLLMDTQLPEKLGAILGTTMKTVFRLPESSAICLVLGIMGGYPVGAQSVATAYLQGKLTRNQAEHMLTFCNNAGPSFVFGVVGALMGGLPVAATLYVIHILSALLTGIILRPEKAEPAPGVSAPIQLLSAPPVLYSSIRSMAIICGYVLLFGVLSAILERYLGAILPGIVQVGISGVLELSGGCLRLAELESMAVGYLFVSAFLSLGGVCVWMQTRDLIKPAGLSGNRYFLGKILQCALSVALTALVMQFIPGLLPRDLPTIHLPNHDGLLTTMIWVFVSAAALFGLWCVILRNRAGKERDYDV
ncbi:MAG: hypothetical protein E7459_00530 [Ruminococcaceae bacterium]|nr:hypothetical protein [Oscillospiraceae bacterium]